MVENGQSLETAEGVAPDVSACGHCGTHGATMRCGRCKRVRYCSGSCQKSHWKGGGHKQVCVASSPAGAPPALASSGLKHPCPICHVKEDTFAAATPPSIPSGICAFCGQLWCGDCNTDAARLARDGCSQCGVSIHSSEVKQLAAVRRLAQRSTGRFLPKAHYMIGNFHSLGRGGLRQNKAAAASWYRSAADLGDRDAQHNLAQLYLAGTGVPRDSAKAAHWFRLAAEQGVTVSQHNLAVRLATGDGVPVNKAEALVWYRRAAENGHIGAIRIMGTWHMGTDEDVEKDIDIALHWLQKGADLCDTICMFRLAVLLDEERPHGLEESVKEAVKWLGKVMGDPAASQEYRMHAIEYAENIMARPCVFGPVSVACTGSSSCPHCLR